MYFKEISQVEHEYMSIPPEEFEWSSYGPAHLVISTSNINETLYCTFLENVLHMMLIILWWNHIQ